MSLFSERLKLLVKESVKEQFPLGNLQKYANQKKIKITGII